MSLNEKEAVIKEYFGMWVLRISEIHQWIDKMLKEQVVIEWTIKRFIHQADSVVVEWFFKHKMQDKISGFDGVSIIEFTEDGTIYSIKEFASEAIHTTPFR